MQENQKDRYTIKLPQFEGPFDLLLFFIKRDELDIKDIPITKLTQDFLAYIKEMERLNIDLASDFIAMAATLMRIKAKMLLPRPQLDAEGNELDPRAALVQRLMEYKQYKEVLPELSALEDERFKRFSRSNASVEMQRIAQKAMIEAEWESMNLYQLLKTFQKLLLQKDKKPIVHKIYKYPYTIAEKKHQIRHLVFESIEPYSFTLLIDKMANRVEAIVTFLALLEMLNLGQLQLVMGSEPNQFWLSKSEKTYAEEE